MSRLWAMLCSLAQTFAANEMRQAIPYVQKAVEELPTDLAASKPLVAFTHTAHNALTAMSADASLKPSLTGLLGAVASAAMSGFVGAPASPPVEAPAPVALGSE